MHSGNVGLSQNLDVLVEAADRLRSKERLTIAIVGDGAKRRDARGDGATSRGLTNVRFLPYQPKALLHDSFAAADAFLVSLKAGIEGYIVPSKVYGILAAGRPYIAAIDPSSEPAQIARESGCGLVAAPGDPDGARRRDRDAVRRSGDDARRWARARGRRRGSSTAGSRSQAYHDLFERVAGVGAGRMIKRTFDCALAGVGLVVSAPLWVADRGGDQARGRRPGVLSGRSASASAGACSTR